ncbi:UNVERIFIED_CONTAM: hydroxyacid dehydrogenase [Halobacillus marinus]
MIETHNPESYIKSLPVQNEEEWENAFKDAYADFQHKIVVLDDDPTGVQTVHGVTVFTDWEEATIRKGFEEDGQIFFILTNSRAFRAKKTEEVHRRIAARVEQIAQENNTPYLLISRGDSTLRGHYPLETEVLKNELERRSERRIDGEIILPYFKEGGRLTVEGVHYIVSDGSWTPVGESEFAGDRTFGFSASHLGDYVEEMTDGAYKAEDVTHVTLASIRQGEIEAITDQLMKVDHFGKVIVDAVTETDVKVFTIALIQALQSGKEFLYRTAATFTKIVGNIHSKPLLTKEELVHDRSEQGGLVVVGSHVQKTTDQLEQLKTISGLHFIEFNSHLVLEPKAFREEVERVRREADEKVEEGTSTVIYTRRDRLELGDGQEEKELMLSVQISEAVTAIVRQLKSSPKYIIAKGGITSSDVGTNGLGVKQATVKGQVAPGVPVWETSEESKYPHLPYIIFPGNVGTIHTLKEVVALID